jgi:hypothetical protein
MVAVRIYFIQSLNLNFHSSGVPFRCLVAGNNIIKTKFLLNAACIGNNIFKNNWVSCALMAVSSDTRTPGREVTQRIYVDIVLF